MEISMYTAGTKPFIFLKFYHTNGKSMEISMYKAGSKLLIISVILSSHWLIHRNFHVQGWKKTIYILVILPCQLLIHGNFHGPFRYRIFELASMVRATCTTWKFPCTLLNNNF